MPKDDEAQALFPVTPEDKWQAAWDALPDGMHAYERARQAGINALGQSHSLPGDAPLANELRDAFPAGDKLGVRLSAHMFGRILAALTPSPCPGDGMRAALDELPDLKPVQLCGLSWKQALKALGAVDCALRRPHWCSPVVILKDGMPVIDDDGDIKPFDFMPGDRTAMDWAMVPRVGDDGKDVPLVYRASLPIPSALSGDAGEGNRIVRIRVTSMHESCNRTTFYVELTTDEGFTMTPCGHATGSDYTDGKGLTIEEARDRAVTDAGTWGDFLRITPEPLIVDGVEITPRVPMDLYTTRRVLGERRAALPSHQGAGEP